MKKIDDEPAIRNIKFNYGIASIVMGFTFWMFLISHAPTTLNSGILFVIFTGSIVISGAVGFVLSEILPMLISPKIYKMEKLRHSFNKNVDFIQNLSSGLGEEERKAFIDKTKEMRESYNGMLKLFKAKQMYKEYKKGLKRIDKNCGKKDLTFDDYIRNLKEEGYELESE